MVSYQFMELDKRIESVLFWKGEPLQIAELARMLPAPVAEVEAALAALEQALATRGARLMRNGDLVTLAAAPEASELITRLHREELDTELGKAALETLSIILYRAPVSRRDIECIRGVNSTFILRALLMRGLIERAASEKDERIFLYRPSFELFSFLGIARAEELPEYAVVREEMAAFEANDEARGNNEER